MKIEKRYRPEILVSKGKEPNVLLTDPYLDAKEDRLVASDGHALVALPVETEKGERARYLACALLKAARKLGDPELPAEIHEEEIVDEGVLWRTAQERTFIKWQEVVPKFNRGSPGTVTFALNPGLLARLATAMGAGGVCLTIELGRAVDQPSPIIVQPLDPEADELGLLMPMKANGHAEPILAPGQVCPECGKILAAGAPCPTHGLPPGVVAANRAPDVAERVKAAAKEVEGSGTTITIRAPSGKEITTTPAEIRAGLDELKRRKVAGAPGELAWAPVPKKPGAIEAQHPAGGSFRVFEGSEGWELVKVKAGKGGLSVIGRDFPSESAAKAHAARLVAEALGDDLLRKAGDGDLAAKDLSGPAVARKKGGRRG
jgi:hypothetical protein